MAQNREGNRGGENAYEPRDHNLHPDESPDPYLNDPPRHEPARCSVCGNIYANKRWYHSDQYELAETEEAHSFTCPGCQKVQDNYYFGELSVSGQFIAEHHEEISGLIQNEVHRRQKKNPLSKLVEVEVDKDAEQPEIIFHTTTGKLTELLSQALEKAFGGQLDLTESGPVTRANWRRND